jgi:hypothetical protein
MPFARRQVRVLDLARRRLFARLRRIFARQRLMALAVRGPCAAIVVRVAIARLVARPVARVVVARLVVVLAHLRHLALVAAGSKRSRLDGGPVRVNQESSCGAFAFTDAEHLSPARVPEPRRS